MDNTRKIVRQYILHNFLPGENSANLKDDTELKESGILDSISTLKLVTYLEEHFKIEVEISDLEADTLSTISKIEGLVNLKKA